MSFDLSDLLRDWPYEPGQLQVRKIVGVDGREKLQLRLDMGVLQMELRGRPDGREPHGMETELEYQVERARKEGDDFELTVDEIGTLQAEGVQYYHRYLALFQLGDWVGVVRDTKRNLEMFSFVAKHAPDEESAWSVQMFRPYVLMMNTRAKASLALEKDDVPAAIALVEKGIGQIERFAREHSHGDEGPGGETGNSEIGSLREWLGELRKLKPLTPVEKLRHEMEKAVKDEKYERAAELRDAIRELRRKG
jgi:hypothetical protein